MTVVTFDIGTNIDREASLVDALERLSEKFELKRISSVYSSTPVGMANQPDYFNISLEVETDMSVEDIRSTVRGIEDAMGRNRSGPKFGPRIIDIDIVLFGALVDEDQKVPHPQSEAELFVVMPLAEVCPDGRHPVSGLSWTELRRKLLAGRSPKDAGIARHSAIGALPLGPRASAQLGLDSKD